MKKFLANLFGMFKKQKKTPAKKVCLEFLDSVIFEMINEKPTLASAADDIRQMVAEGIRTSKLIDTRIREGQSHAKIVYRLLESACRWKLISGELHVYRGMLGMFGGEYLALWEAIVKRYASVEDASQEQVDALRAELREGIAQAG